MRKLQTCYTVSEDNVKLIKQIAEELGISKSKAADLILTVVREHIGVTSIVIHYKNSYNVSRL